MNIYLYTGCTPLASAGPDTLVLRARCFGIHVNIFCVRLVAICSSPICHCSNEMCQYTCICTHVQSLHSLTCFLLQISLAIGDMKAAKEKAQLKKIEHQVGNKNSHLHNRI